MTHMTLGCMQPCANACRMFRLRGCFILLCLCSAKDLIQHLLVVDPTKRLSASQALQHAWVTAASMEGPELEPLQEALMKLRECS